MPTALGQFGSSCGQSSRPAPLQARVRLGMRDLALAQALDQYRYLELPS
jgi:hypothetical protein